jgi:hypothetical protein
MGVREVEGLHPREDQYTEGLDTADLQEAKALLDDLARAVAEPRR